MTIAEAEALGRAYLAAGGPWRPGMLWYVTRAAPLESYHGRIDERGHPPTTGSAWPDFRDPATVGVLLAVVREAWGAPSLYACIDTGGTWSVGRDDFDVVATGPTEAAALVSAFEARPGRTP